MAGFPVRSHEEPTAGSSCVRELSGQEMAKLGPLLPPKCPCWSGSAAPQHLSLASCGQMEKWAKGWIGHFSKDDRPMASRCVTRLNVRQAPSGDAHRSHTQNPSPRQSGLVTHGTGSAGDAGAGPRPRVCGMETRPAWSSLNILNAPPPLRARSPPPTPRPPSEPAPPPGVDVKEANPLTGMWVCAVSLAASVTVAETWTGPALADRRTSREDVRLVKGLLLGLEGAGTLHLPHSDTRGSGRGGKV